MPNDDMNLICRQCGKQFVFTRGEQDFFKLKGFTSPSHCPECRSSRQNQPCPFACSQCGVNLGKGESIYCTACLASVHLEFELRNEQNKKAVSEIQSKLLAIESQKAKIEESLHQKEQLAANLKTHIESLSHDFKEADREAEEAQLKLRSVEIEKAQLVESVHLKDQLAAELEGKVSNLSQELEKLRQLHADLQWLHPAINSMGERLKALEYGQEKTNHRMLQIVQKVQEMYENTGMFEIVKRSLSNALIDQKTQKERGR